MREHRAGCRFRPPSCPFASRPPFCWPVGRHVRLRNPIKSTIAHDAVAAVVLHKHHLIIRVGAGLIQFVYGSHSRFAADLTLDKNLFFLPFSRAESVKNARWSMSPQEAGDGLESMVEFQVQIKVSPSESMRTNGKDGKIGLMKSSRQNRRRMTSSRSCYYQPGGGLTRCQSLKVEDGGKGHTSE